MSEKADKGNVRFHSKDIGDKHRQGKLFVNVKGEAKRQRQQRRKDAVNERKVLREARRDARKQKKTAQKVAFTKKTNKVAQRHDRWQLRKVAFANLWHKISTFTKYLFSGKRLLISIPIVTIIVVLLGNMFVYRCIIIPVREARFDDQYAKYVENDAPTVEGVSSYVNFIMANDATADEALEYIDGIRKRYDENSDIYFILTVYYANFLGRNKDFEQGIKELDTIRDKAGEIAFRQEYLYNAYYELYSIHQDYEKGNEYAEKVNALRRRIVKKKLETSEGYYIRWSGF